MTSPGSLAFGAFWIALGLFVAYEIHDSNAHPMMCVEKTTVKSILALNYRSATILTSDGMEHEVSQATLKPGDDFCLRYEKK